MKLKNNLEDVITSIPEHIREEDLSKLFYAKEKKAFIKWMFGQTMMLLDGKPCYYLWDVEQFIKGGKTFD